MEQGGREGGGGVEEETGGGDEGICEGDRLRMYCGDVIASDAIHASVAHLPTEEGPARTTRHHMVPGVSDSEIRVERG
ncbi:hypothetical protein CCP4SC76_1080003 [Gammaproteobacteria bacterium]